MRIDSSGRLLLGTTTEGEGDADNLTIADTGNCGITLRSGGSNDGAIFFSDGVAGVSEYRGTIQYTHSNDSLLFKTHSSIALTLDGSQNATFAGTVSDSKGEIRSIPKSAKTANYTLAASDSGKCIAMNGSGLTLTILHNTMTAETATTILNNSANELTLAKGASMTLYNSADGSTPTKLAARGMATIYFEGQDVGYISGAGLS